MKDPQYLGIATNKAAPPVWRQLGASLQFALQRPALLALAALTTGVIVGQLAGGTTGATVLLLVWLCAHRYGLEITRDTAHGRHSFPKRVWWPLDASALTHLALIAGITVSLVAVNHAAGPVPAAALAVLVTLWQPAALIVLALNRRLRTALRPAFVARTMRELGVGYACAAAISGGVNAAAAWLAFRGDTLPPAAVLLVAAAALAALLAAHAFIGTLMYQHHRALGFVRAGMSPTANLHDPDQQLLDHAEQFVSAGDHEAALALLHTALRQRSVSLGVHARYHQLLQQLARPQALREHTGHYINRLLMERHDHGALALLRQALDEDASFVPPLPELAQQLVDHAYRCGQQDLATRLQMAMVRAWPRSPDATVWALDAAHWLASQHRTTHAAELLQYRFERVEDPEQRAMLASALAALDVAAR